MSDRFENMPAWRKSHELTLFVYEQIVPRLPGDERSGLAVEITRASMTVGASLAGASGHFYTKEQARRCFEARGLLYETINYLLLINDLAYISADLYRQARNLADEAVRLLNEHIATLKRK